MSANQVKNTQFIDLSAEEEPEGSLIPDPIVERDEDEESEHTSDREFIDDRASEELTEDDYVPHSLDAMIQHLEEEWDDDLYQQLISRVAFIKKQMDDILEDAMDIRERHQGAERLVARNKKQKTEK